MLALYKSSLTSGDPFIYIIFGNLFIYSQIFVGFSSDNITIYYQSFKYNALNGKIK